MKPETEPREWIKCPNCNEKMGVWFTMSEYASDDSISIQCRNYAECRGVALTTGITVRHAYEIPRAYARLCAEVAKEKANAP